MIFKTSNGPGFNRPASKALDVGDVFPQQQTTGNTPAANPAPPAPPMPPEVAEWFAQNGGYPQMQQQQAVVVQGNEKRTSHAFHLIMSLITFGFWIPVWILCWLVNQGR